MGAMRSRLPLAEQRDEVECRRCGVVCQKVIHPQRCMEQCCPFLYAYEAFGHKYAGCLQGVFGVAIDASDPKYRAPVRGVFGSASHVEPSPPPRKRPNGFGALRALREPLPMC